MSDIPKDLKYTEEHEWVRMEGSVGVCGITDYAQEMLTDIVYVELPEVDIEIGQGEQVAVVESVKAVSDVYAPLSGTIVEINEELEDSPEMVNDDPYGEGWIFKIEVEDDNEQEGKDSQERGIGEVPGVDGDIVTEETRHCVHGHLRPRVFRGETLEPAGSSFGPSPEKGRECGPHTLQAVLQLQ